MYRTLRFQLVAIVVATVATVLAISQWLDTRLSMRELERDLEARALLALGTVDSLWERSAPATLDATVGSIVRTSRDIVAIDVFRLEDGAAVRTLTTRSGDADTPDIPPAADAQALAARGSATARAPGPDGEDIWRLAVPIRRAGRVVGIAQADVSLASVDRLRSRLRIIDDGFVVLSVAVISLALGGFLERRVTRPVAALTDGMRRAESGALGSRVVAQGSGEFTFLAGSLNRMLSRIEDLTTGLERRVRQATHDLAEKNRELEQANDQLWRAQLEVVRSERFAALGQMAATIAHELGTPLNSVLGYTQLLLRADLPSEQAAKLAIVESQVQRMIETMRSVLDRTRDRTLARAPVALGPLVTEAMVLVSTRLAGRRLVARNEVPADLPPVPADAVGLRQVLLNLLTNAIDATDTPGTITVSAALGPNGRGGAPHVELVVRDSGHGMAPDELRRVVEPFYTTKAPGRGTGLGLVIVDHIVRAHGGRLVIESEPGRGTTMRVQLPLEV